MVDNVNGLRPVGNSNQSVRRKEGRVADRKATRLTTALAPAAARVSTFKGVTAATQDKSSELLMNALGKLNPAINNFVTAKQSSDDETILNQAEYHMERIREELGNGTVTAVQVGELLPEASATVRAKITQSMGSRQGKEFIAPILDEIESDDTVRLSTELRNKRLEEAKAEALALSDDPFYANGVMSAINAKINQSEQRWQLETAKYHKDAVRDEYKDEIANTILNGGDLLEWDSVAKQTGPFMDRERNEIVTATAMDLAVESGNPEILNTVPERFLNAETKRKFGIVKQQIEKDKYAQWSQQRTMDEENRKLFLRDKKVEIIQRSLDGNLSAKDYRQHPELFAYATQLASTASMDKTTSVINSQRIQNGIFQAALTGDISGSLGKFGYDGDLTEDGLYDFILGSNNLNATEKQNLAKAVPELLKGQVLLQQPAVKDSLNIYLRPALENLRKSPNAKIQSLLDGSTIESDVIDAYEGEITFNLMSYYNEHGRMPKSFEFNGIVKEARKSALELMRELTKVENTGTTPAQAQQNISARKFTFDAQGNPILPEEGD